ncbi:hypothetical protein [Serratia fonticola]|uniref:hypothetical protein n=1 Tax=Serratia fonticola TaxID=47917 RepID=UPI00301DB150
MILDRMGVGGVMHPDTLVNTGATLPTTSSAPLPGGQSLTFSAEEWHLLSATWKGVDIARLTRQWGIPAPTLYSRRKRVLWRLGLRQASDLHAWRHALMRRDLTVMH